MARKILYAYRYGIVGGVSTQLLLRRAALRAVGIECQIFFSQDNGLGHVLTDPHGVHFGSEIAFSRLVKRERFDAVIVIDSPELLSAAAGPFYRKNPVFLDVHTTTTTGLSYLNDVSMKGLAAITVPTHHSAAIVSARIASGSTVSVVPNILDTVNFQPDLASLSSEGAIDRAEHRQFVWVGKLDSHKNWRLALVHAAMLKELFGQITLHVVGGYTAPESQARSFFELAHRLNISANINWLDRVENTTLAMLYRRCAAGGGAMLVTSRDESFGMAAAEALLCGCPLIANDLQVFHEVLPKSPLVKLVDIWQPEAVAQAALTLPTPPHQDDIVFMQRDLATRYGADAFSAAFSDLLGRAR